MGAPTVCKIWDHREHAARHDNAGLLCNNNADTGAGQEMVLALGSLRVRKDRIVRSQLAIELENGREIFADCFPDRDGAHFDESNRRRADRIRQKHDGPTDNA